MSLNTAHAHGGVLIYAGESILVHSDGVDLDFEGVDIAHFKGTKKGRIYLTTHRVVFTNKNGKDMLQSFSMPFLMLREVALEQPIFGANYIKGKVIAEEGGNWQGTAKFKLKFTSGGAIEFGQAMLRAGQLASRNRPAQPPPYTPPAGPFYSAPPPAYYPPQTPYYSWVPTNTFPTAPPPDSVYMTSAPPPYPGVDPNMAPYPPPQANGMNGYAQGNSNDEKAREAAASGYYNPQAPHDVYVPQASAPSYTDLPPPYSEVEKKKN
ncbi:WW domain-binding protein 2-like [Liolophura sinensis]|uniref:WW domain-binding protein 2-like n=1 Tax=Liolophura sinensis TaxID=3198878 RepID=UPI003158DC8F